MQDRAETLRLFTSLAAGLDDDNLRALLEFLGEDYKARRKRAAHAYLRDVLVRRHSTPPERVYDLTPRGFEARFARPRVPARPSTRAAVAR